MNRLDFGTIFKRSSCLNSSESKIDSERIFKRLNDINLESIREGYIPYNYTSILEDYTKLLSNKNNASNYWYRGLEILQNLNNHNADREAKRFTESYILRILPYVENMEGVLEALDRYDLEDYQYNNIKNICEQYKLADKILNNHEKISKRFNIEEVSKGVKIRGLHSVVEKCCSMIDTYSYEPYQKLNMCIEEITYLFEKNNIDYRQDELLSSVLEYFLLRSASISDRDIRGYRYVMEHNSFVDDISVSKFLFEDFDIINIQSSINSYLKTQEKTPELTEVIFGDIINSTSIGDLKKNVEELLNLLYRIYTSQVTQDCGTDDMLKAISTVLNSIVDRYEKEAMDNMISRDDVIELIAIFERLKSKIPVNDVNDQMIISKMNFKNTLGFIITNRLNDITNSIYSKDNLDSLEYVNSDNVEEVALREFKIFKFNNIIKATTNFDKFLGRKFRNFINRSAMKAKVKRNKIKNILFDESGRPIFENIYSFIGEDNKVDICLCQIELNSEKDITEALDELTVLCKEFNNELNVNGLDTIRSYYIINGCIAEVHIKDSTKLILTEEEQLLARTAYKPELDIYIEQLALFEACNIIADNFDDKTIDEKIASTFMSENLDFSLEAYDVAMDALSLIGVTKNQVDMFTERFSSYRNSILTESADIITENRLIKSIYNNWEPVENVPFDIQVEAFDIFNTILNEAAPKVKKVKVGGEVVKKSVPDIKKAEVNSSHRHNDNDEKKEGDDKEYNPSSSISNKLNNAKIYIQALKSKAKDLSQKEKELSRQLDSNFAHFSKSLKDAFVSDRRESIIKGSVIPSFSKSLKICIGLTLLGVVTGNIAVPLIAALGGFAVSKQLTKRERILLLDEIETELEVVEKEIANADAKNQIKKYRALLKYKKDLQRQYQRIKYNVKVGKDILPGSAVGFKEKN